MRLHQHLVVTLLAAAATLAVEPVPLSWDDCLKAARQHPDLFSAELSLQQAREGIVSSRAGWMPSVGASVSAGESGDSSDSESSYSAGLSARQLLFDAGRTSHGIAAARDAATVSMADLELVSAAVRESIRVAFVELLRVQERVGVVADIRKRRKESLELVRLRYEAGREHRGSLLTAEANAARAELDERSAGRDLDQARANLAVALGHDEIMPWQATGNLSPVSATNQQPDPENLIDEHPTLRQFSSRLSSARHGLAGAKADGWPSVSLSAGTGLGGADWPPEEDSWNVGVGLSLSLFEGGRRLSSVRSGRADVEVATQAERAGRQALRASLVQAWMDFMDAVEGVAVQEKFLEAARERSGISEAQYSSGMLSFDNWIIIEDELVRSMTSLLDARASALKAEARWLRVCGRTLDDE